MKIKKMGKTTFEEDGKWDEREMTQQKKRNNNAKSLQRKMPVIYKEIQIVKLRNTKKWELLGEG